MQLTSTEKLCSRTDNFSTLQRLYVGIWQNVCINHNFTKISWGVSELLGSKIAISHWRGPWLIQQLVLPSKLWLDYASFI